MRARIRFGVLAAVTVVAGGGLASAFACAGKGPGTAQSQVATAAPSATATALPPAAGTPLAGRPLPLTYGGLRVVTRRSAESPPSPEPPRPGLKQTHSEARENADCTGFVLLIDPAAIAGGWQVSNCSGAIITWDDGEATNTVFTGNYSSGSQTFSLDRRRLSAGELADVEGDAGVYAAYLTTAGGVPAIVRQGEAGGALLYEVAFVKDGVYNRLAGQSGPGGGGITLPQLLAAATAVAGVPPSS